MFRKMVVSAKRLGFIAEDVYGFVPAQSRKHLNTMGLAAVLTKAVQEQQKMLQYQKKTMVEMAKRIETLELTVNYCIKGL